MIATVLHTDMVMSLSIPPAISATNAGRPVKRTTTSLPVVCELRQFCTQNLIFPSQEMQAR